MVKKSNALPEGTILNGGNYTILGKIGEGGFGITYLAQQRGLNRKVCIKEYFLSGRCTRDVQTLQVECTTEETELFEKYRQAFMHEAEMVASVNHPNVVEVIAIFSENNSAYMVMQYIEGQTLETLVSKRGALPLEEAKNYMSQIAEAVGYIHERNILHRDIKPSNIIITPDYRAILIDFGSAREFVDDKTQAHTSLLTRGYAPPEQYSTVSRKGRYSDIYSLGATLYYVLTGKQPVDAAARMIEPFPEPKSLNAAIPPRLNSAIMKAMSINPADRYQDVHSFVADLWTKEKNEGSAAKPPAPAPLKGQTKAAKQDVQEKRKKNKTWLWVLLAVLGVLLIPVVAGLNSGSREKRIKTQSKTDTVFNVDGVSFKMVNVDGVSFKMVYVEGGTFTMGCTSEQGDECWNDEKPAHQVTLSSYSIGETEVTQALWKAVMGNNPSYYKGDDLPVENVSWDDIQTFISELNRKTGCTFRLPTEAEWEYAARGGNKSRGYKYSGSNAIGDVAWYLDNSGEKTHPVKTKKSNELGLYDMSGNVEEWCSDAEYDYGSSAERDPKHPGDSGSSRVGRGGSWDINAGFCRVSFRYINSYASYRINFLGFRLVLEK